jgi:hypothetical protein
MSLLTFVLACYGATMIAVYGKIFDSIRPKATLFHCTMCLGFWVGVAFTFLLEVPFNAFIGGCISSGCSYFISRLVDDDGILIKVKKSNYL